MLRPRMASVSSDRSWIVAGAETASPGIRGQSCRSRFPPIRPGVRPVPGPVGPRPAAGLDQADQSGRRCSPKLFWTGQSSPWNLNDRTAMTVRGLVIAVAQILSHAAGQALPLERIGAFRVGDSNRGPVERAGTGRVHGGRAKPLNSGNHLEIDVATFEDFHRAHRRDQASASAAGRGSRADLGPPGTGPCGAGHLPGYFRGPPLLDDGRTHPGRGHRIGQSRQQGPARRASGIRDQVCFLSPPGSELDHHRHRHESAGQPA